MLISGLVALLMLQAQPQTAQAAFDAADALAVRQDWAGALAGYEQAEARIRNARTLGVLKVRQGDVLLMLGRDAEARTRLRDGLEKLRAEPTLAAFRASGYEQLARSEESAFELTAALGHYRDALPLAAETPARLAILGGIVRTAMFIDPPAGVAAADAAYGLAAAAPGMTAESRGQYENLRGRALLNAGRFAEAKTQLVHAVSQLGGLTRSLNGSDLAARSDAAIAALRAKDAETARRYLAFTGAGREGQFGFHGEIAPPPCGDGGDEPAPEDVVVVQFKLGDEGAVAGVSPIYASRPGPMIEAFLHAVAEWSWPPEQAALIRPFFRSAVRVEMRCLTAVKRPTEIALLDADLDRWGTARGVAALPDMANMPMAARLERLRRELAAREAAAGIAAPALLPVIRALLDHPMTENDEMIALAGRGRAIATAANAPVPVVTLFALRAAAARPGLRKTKAGYMQEVVRAHEEVVADPVVAGDGRALGVARLYAAGWRDRTKNLSAAAAHLDAIVADSRLTARDPIRVGALVRLASLKVRQGDAAAAQAAFEQSGLDAAQCALVDAKPEMRQRGLSSSDYPMEAIRWGFEGATRSEFDIAADGRPRNIRTVLAYPPFVFATASEQGIAQSRFTQTFRPGGAMGCGGQQFSVGYRLPDINPPAKPKKPGDRAAAAPQ